MTTHTTIKSYGALALGVFFTAITARTIFDDVWNGAPVTVAHINAAAALVAAIASGHFVVPTILQGRIPAALGLALIFIGSTGYIVTSAGARNAEVSNLKAASIVKVNEERAALKAKIAAAEADVDEAKTAHDKAKADAATACKTGVGPKCEGTTKTRNDADLDVQKAEAFAMLQRGRLSMLGPEQKPFEGYAHAAKVFEAAGVGNAGVIEARLELLLPFALVLISELGTLVFLSMAIGREATISKMETVQTAPRLVVSDEPAPMAITPANDVSGQSDFAAVSEFDLAKVAAMFRGDVEPDGNGGPNGGARIIRPRRWQRDEVRADLTERLANGDKFPSQRAMAEMYGVPASTLCNWFEAWANEGQAVKRQQIGRRNAVG